MKNYFVSPSWDVFNNPTTPEQVLDKLKEVTGMTWDMEILENKDLRITLTDEYYTGFITRIHQQDKPRYRRLLPGDTALFMAWLVQSTDNDQAEPSIVYDQILPDNRL